MEITSLTLDTAFWVTAGSIAVLLMLSAFFSGSETALTAASRGKLRSQADKGSKGAERALRITEDNERLIGSVLLGNNLVNILATSLATALFKRGLRHQVIQDVRPVKAKGRNMVGPAFTLRYIPAREDRNALSVFRNPEHPQRHAIETCPEGHVMVMDSRKDARAASAGDILITRLMVRGGAGVVTDGGFRDAMRIGELEMPAYHHRPSSPTNLTINEAIDINVPIGCGDAPVFPGDIVVGDDDSVIVIPAHLADEIADEATEMTAYEEFVVEQVKAGETIIGLYPATSDESLEKFEAWRKKNQR